MIGRRADSSGFSEDLGGPWEVHWDCTHPSSSSTSLCGNEPEWNECRPDSTSTRVLSSKMVSASNSESTSELLSVAVGESKDAREPNGSQWKSRRIEVTTFLYQNVSARFNATECARWPRRGAGTRIGWKLKADSGGSAETSTQKQAGVIYMAQREMEFRDHHMSDMTDGRHSSQLQYKLNSNAVCLTRRLRKMVFRYHISVFGHRSASWPSALR